jgi:hypothetical protein
MWPYEELIEVNEDCLSDYNPMRTKQEIEEIVVFVRLELYNLELPCGPKAIRKRMDTFYLVKPLPSESTIARILTKRCLTHRRTGWYE